MRRNKRKHTPIPGLANHMRFFNRKRKAQLAELRATLADRLLAISYRPRRERL